MENKFVKVLFDIDCEWTGPAPSYRIFVDGELFAERTYIWTDCYLHEMLQISAEPGHYLFDFQNLNPDTATFTIKNRSVLQGPARWVNDKYLEIRHES